MQQPPPRRAVPPAHTWLTTLRRDLGQGGVSLAAWKVLGALRRAHQLGRYRWTPRRLTTPLAGIRIDRPIFILGVQGGGATILARCLHRHPRGVYACGNSDFWTGPDEIHCCPHIPDVPEPLVHRTFHFGTAEGVIERHPRYGYQRAWLYAIDEFLPLYARTATDVDPATTAAFQQVLRKIIRAYAHDPQECRFVDKSQLFTIQVPYIAAMLAGSNPHFVLVARNPYAACSRAVTKEYGPDRGGHLSDDLDRRIDCAVEHWSNSYRLALEAADRVPLLKVRYEDFLTDPRREVERICEFADLDFRPEQIPGPGQPMHLGALDVQKWHPLRREENRGYLKGLHPRLVRGLEERAGDVMADLGYDRLEAASV